MQTSRSTYSTVNRTVSTHSSTKSAVPCLAAIEATLSSATATTLRAMATIRAMSKIFPAGVSVS